ncbi:hypothetical protein GCM10008955_06200 [Deinococcus malanensis]|uniref:GGDEF domain-containing protein n=1 Tax=Deinococcus malanensis TaxID=1706855 RepID=A0ABQ2EKK9_9DEIO|nr:GGDEF domain-containing protein [Deinococcus malanensis]GGK15541.1 hypothetical protein GCM10008955_06200 [Deinococcus malanensis]
MTPLLLPREGPSPQPEKGLLLRLVAAGSRQDVLDQLLEGMPGLRGLTLWGEEGTMLMAWAGERQEQTADRVPLSPDPEYWLSTVPVINFPPEILAVAELRLLYLDAQETSVLLGNNLATLTAAAKTDALTGLPNRHALEMDLKRIDAAGAPFAVVFIDLDGFKAINDRYGHALGDSLLKGYGLWLSRVTGPWGRVYRMGGDEYLLLMTDFPGSPEDFQVWAHERLQIPFVDGVSASIGIAWRHEDTTISDVMRLADTRMYQAKSARSGPSPSRRTDRRTTHKAAAQGN